jgi:hypothetical protein
MDILPVAVHHWRFPIILTELLPHPFPPTDPSFAAQILTNYRDRLHQQEGIKGYAKQELVLQDHYHCVLGFLTLINTMVDLTKPEEVSKHNAPLQSAHPTLGNDTTGVAIMPFLCAQNFSYQDLSNDTTLYQIKLNSTTDADANVKKLTISLASAYPNLYSPLAEIDFGIKTAYKFYNRTKDGNITESVASFNFSLPIFLNKIFHVTFFNHTRQPSDTGTEPRTVFCCFVGKMNLTVYTLCSDVGAGTSARIINNQLKAVDFEDDIILQWKPGHWSNFQKTQCQHADQGVAFTPFPHQHNGLHGHTYKNGLQRRFIHIHKLQDFSTSALFPTSAWW